MSEKDNIKLKTDTLSSRKSSPSAGVHVKRKRKIIAKPVINNKKTDDTTSVESKEILDSKDKLISKESLDSKLSKTSEPQSHDNKFTKKQKIDKDEKMENLDNKELHLKSPKPEKR
jgi:hypothetical protein